MKHSLHNYPIVLTTKLLNNSLLIFTGIIIVSLFIIFTSDIYKYKIELTLDYASHDTFFILSNDNNSFQQKGKASKGNEEQSVIFLLPNDRLTNFTIKSYQNIGKTRISQISITKHFDFKDISIHIPLLTVKGSQLFETFTITKNNYPYNKQKYIELTENENVAIRHNLNNIYIVGFIYYLMVVLGIPLLIFFTLRHTPRLIESYASFSQSSFIKKHSFVLPLVIIILMTVIIYKDFLIFKVFYIYYDIGSDTINYFWPLFHHISDYIKTDGIPSWSFNLGLGQNIYPRFISDPFSLILFIINPQYIPHLLVYTQVLKIIIAGLLFYLYVRTLQLSKNTAVVGAILYAFNGHMIVRGGWYHYATDCVIFAFILYAVELFIQKKSWILLPIAFFSVYWKGNSQSFYVIAFGIVILLYALFRYIELYNFDIKKITIFVAKLSTLYLIGILMGSFILFPEFYTLTTSSRLGGEDTIFASLLQYSPFTINTKDQISISLASLLSPSLPKVDNILEYPLFYQGILLLFGIPHALVYATRKKRILYIGVLICIAIYFIFPYPRFLFNLFSGFYYKINSFWITIFLLYLGLSGLDWIFKKKSVSFISVISIFIFVLTFLLSQAFSRIPTLNTDLVLIYEDYEYLTTIHTNTSLYFVLFFTTAYLILLTLLHKKGKQINFQYWHSILVLVLCVEILCYAIPIVNNRFALKPEHIDKHKGYFDSTKKAISFIRDNDSSLYRIDKNYLSVHFNDSLIQDYYGTKAYQSFNHWGYVNILKSLKVENNKKYEVLLETYDLRLPNYILGLEERTILNTIVGVKYYLTKNDDTVQDEIPYGYTFYKKIDSIYIYKNLYFLPIGIVHDKLIAEDDFVKYKQKHQDLILLKHAVIDNTNKIPDEFKGLNHQNDIHISDNYYQEYSDAITSIRENIFRVTDHTHKKIQGTINTEKDGVLFLSIPHDKGWHAKINGKEDTIHPISFGMSGIYLTKGQNTIELRYEIPYIKEGFVVSMVTVTVYITLVYFSKQKKRLNK